MPEPSATFANLRVAAFESRRSAELADLIRQYRGQPIVAPAMREVAIPRNPEAVDFANRVMTGQVDALIFTTGAGVRRLVEQIQRHVDRSRFLSAVSDAMTIARGPKPVAALRELGIEPRHQTPAPHTWREILQVVDRAVPLANQTVGLQEYGQPNASLLAGLEARGATVINLRLYHWELPEDTAALSAALRQIADGQIEVVLFTSSHQIINVLHLAQRTGLADQLRQGLRGAVIASIGPDTTATLRQNDLPVDVQPNQPTMEDLVAAAAAEAAKVLAKKRWLASVVPAEAKSPGLTPDSRQPLPSQLADQMKPAALDPADPVYDSLFLKACRREPVPHTPIWLMRQAGRYMPEYRAVREKVGFLELCKNPALCAEVMVTAVRRLGVDAAIIFSDLLPILEPMGLDLEFSAGEGPVIHNPVREARDVDRVLELESVESLSFVMETVRQTRAGLPRGLPLIGFAGAPFTLASYVIEGGASRNFLNTKTLMYRDSGAWTVLMSRLSRAITRYLNAQIAAGAHAVQLFDSWVGCLSPDDYRRFVLPHVKAVIDGLVPGVPIINFATGNPALIPLQAEAGCDAAKGAIIGVDWRIRLDDAWRAIGYDRAIQGNLDPAVLLADRAEIRRRTQEVLQQAAGRPGHIFNLGHGILPQTPVDNVVALVDAVHELSANR
ncbi:MAG TPA: uroporphyrinogen decarboxylase [Pirellulales bacterium]|nr:uroporphyrinogen decarboxylase [Pirellulales bacterium]